MFSGQEIKTEPTFFYDLQEDVENETRKLGEV